MPLSFANPDFQARADNGRNQWWRYLVTVIWSLFIQVVVAIGIFIAALVGGLPIPTLLAATSDPSQPVIFYTVIGVTFGGWLVGIASGAWFFHKKPVADYLAGWRWTLFLTAAGVWLLVLLGDELADYVLKPAGFAYKASLTLPAAVAIIAGIAVQTFTEEFVFRGYATQGFLHWLKKPLPAAIVAGLVFGACHIPNGVPQAINAAALGIALSLIAIKTGNLAFGYGLHLVNNLMGSLIFVSTNDVLKGTPGLFVQSTPSLDIFDLCVSIVALGIAAYLYGRPASPKT